MATPQRLDSVHIDTFTARVANLPDGCIDNANIEAGANISPSKFERHQSVDSQLFATTDLVSATNEVLHVVRGTTGTILGFEVVYFSTALTTATFLLVDLQKATASTTWATVLSTGISIASSDAAYTPRAGTISAVGMADGDIFRVTVATSGSSTNLPRGLFVSLHHTETYS